MRSPKWSAIRIINIFLRISASSPAAAPENTGRETAGNPHEAADAPPRDGSAGKAPRKPLAVPGSEELIVFLYMLFHELNRFFLIMRFHGFYDLLMIVDPVFTAHFADHLIH